MPEDPAEGPRGRLRQEPRERAGLEHDLPRPAVLPPSDLKRPLDGRKIGKIRKVSSTHSLQIFGRLVFGCIEADFLKQNAGKFACRAEEYFALGKAESLRNGYVFKYMNVCLFFGKRRAQN